MKTDELQLRITCVKLCPKGKFVCTKGTPQTTDQLSCEAVVIPERNWTVSLGTEKEICFFHKPKKRTLGEE